MATTADFKNGLCIEYDGKPFSIIWFQHVKPGKGNTFVKVKMRNLETGQLLEKRFNAGEKINLVNIERRPYQFLYKDESGFHFMHNETFEQVDLPQEVVPNQDLIKEGQYVEMMFHADDERMLSCELPPFVELEVTYAEPAVKGDTSGSTNAQKAVKVETGAEIMVPLFVNQGDRIKIDTRDRAYSERIK